MRHLISLMLCLFIGSHYANAYTGPQSSNRATGGLRLFDAEYENDDDSFDVEGTLLYGGYKAAMSPTFSLAGGLGLMLDGELGQNNKIGDGQGFKLFLESQFDLKRSGANLFALTVSLDHDRYTFEEGNVELDWTMTDIKVGGLIIRNAGPAKLYGGLEVVLYSDGEGETKINGNSFSNDAKRDDRLNLRLGAAFDIDRNFDLRADLLLLGEQTITFAADLSI